jgi:hypothetical protein
LQENHNHDTDFVDRNQPENSRRFAHVLGKYASIGKPEFLPVRRELIEKEKCPAAPTARNRSAGFQTCCIADFQIGWAFDCRAPGRFGNRRYSRLGSLRYRPAVPAREIWSI